MAKDTKNRALISKTFRPKYNFFYNTTKYTNCYEFGLLAEIWTFLGFKNNFN